MKRQWTTTKNIERLEQFNVFRCDALTVFVSVENKHATNADWECPFSPFRVCTLQFQSHVGSSAFYVFYSLHFGMSLFLAFNGTRHISDRHKSGFTQMGITFEIEKPYNEWRGGGKSTQNVKIVAYFQTDFIIWEILEANEFKRSIRRKSGKLREERKRVGENGGKERNSKNRSNRRQR